MTTERMTDVEWSADEKRAINKAFEDACEHGSVDSAAVAAATKAAEMRNAVLMAENEDLRAQVRGVSMVNRDDALARAEMASKIQKLEEMLRLVNDKMAEQVRQARHDVASEVLEDVERFKDLDDVLEFLHKVRIANAPKD